MPWSSIIRKRCRRIKKTYNSNRGTMHPQSLVPQLRGVRPGFHQMQFCDVVSAIRFSSIFSAASYVTMSVSEAECSVCPISLVVWFLLTPCVKVVSTSRMTLSSMVKILHLLAWCHQLWRWSDVMPFHFLPGSIAVSEMHLGIVESQALSRVVISSSNS